MTLLAQIRGRLATDPTPTPTPCRARCRSCGRYYRANEDACPHCGSGSRLLAGPPNHDYDRY